MSDENLEIFRSKIPAIRGYLSELEDEWNTFQYILKDIDNWDGSSKVGTMTVENLRSQTNMLKKRIDDCYALMRICDNFVSEMVAHNNGN